MVTDLDQRLAATLRDHAGGDADPAPLVELARRRGHRLRLRRRLAVSAGAAATGLVLTGAVLAIPTDRSTDPTVVVPAAQPTLPAAPERPGALADPGIVGSDPGVLHFFADDLVDDAEYVLWRAGRGVESVEFQGRRARARFVLTPSAATLDEIGQTLWSSGHPQPPAEVRIAGRPGTAWVDPGPSSEADLWFVRWQPVAGLWAQLDISAPTRDAAVAAAGRVRFDAGQRCVVPFRLASLSPGERLLQCSVRLGRTGPDAVEAGPGGFVEGSLVVGDDSGRWLTVRVQHVPDGPGSRAGELEAGPYRVRRQGSGVLEMTVGSSSVEAFRTGWGDGYAEPAALAVLSGFQPADDPDDPGTW